MNKNAVQSRIGDILDRKWPDALKSIYHGTVNCASCKLAEFCRAPVVGEGNPLSEIMLIGRNPGKDEDEAGFPFIGRGGRLLDRWLDIASLRREQIFITNMVKCHTRNDTTPNEDQVKTCGYLWMRKEIELIKPKLIVLFGGLTIQYFTRKATVKEARLQLFDYPPENVPLKDTKAVCCVHPGAVLHSNSNRKLFEEDASYVAAVVRKLRYDKFLSPEAGL